jgi:hypothetical protein
MRGITIQLLVKTQTGVDALNHPIYSEEWVNVDNVLVGEPTADEIANSLSLNSKMVHYTLGIPKGDTNVWTDTEVMLPSPFEGKYKTIGYPTAGIEANIPLKWNKKVKLERYG